MRPSSSCVIRAGIVAACLIAAGCEQQTGDRPSVQLPAATPVGEPQTTPHPYAGNTPVPAAPEQAERQSVKPKPPQPEPVAGNPEAAPQTQKSEAVSVQEKNPRPLDLSLPPQPQVDLGSLETGRPTARRLLPDLFAEPAPEADGLNLKGRVFMDDTGREDLDGLQGGEIIMEMKTR